MALEAASWIDDLVITNPPGGDTKRQGDDHLRLIKTVLKACFPNATKAFYFPSTASKTANFSVTAAEMHRTFFVDTTAGEVTATLPALAVGDAGWTCYFIKTSTNTNALFIAPASGVIQSGEVFSLAKCRRCIPGHRSTALWTGSSWIVSRVPSVPVGSCIPLHAASLPVGYEWPNGQTLASASTKYPEFYSVNGNSGVTLDKRGRVGAGKDDMGGTSANRLTGLSGGINGDVFGNTGGDEKHVLDVTELTSHVHGPGTLGGTAVSTSTFRRGGGVNVDTGALDAGAPSQVQVESTVTINSGTTAGAGSSAPHNNVQPTLIENQMLVVE